MGSSKATPPPRPPPALFDCNGPDCAGQLLRLPTESDAPPPFRSAGFGSFGACFPLPQRRRRCPHRAAANGPGAWGAPRAAAGQGHRVRFGAVAVPPARGARPRGRQGLCTPCPPLVGRAAIRFWAPRGVLSRGGSPEALLGWAAGYGRVGEYQPGQVRLGTDRRRHWASTS